MLSRGEKINISHIPLLLTTNSGKPSVQTREMENKYIFLVVIKNSPKANNNNHNEFYYTRKHPSHRADLHLLFLVWNTILIYFFRSTEEHQSHLIKPNPLPICYTTNYYQPLSFPCSWIDFCQRGIVVAITWSANKQTVLLLYNSVATLWTYSVSVFIILR